MKTDEKNAPAVPAEPLCDDDLDAVSGGRTVPPAPQGPPSKAPVGPIHMPPHVGNHIIN